MGGAGSARAPAREKPRSLERNGERGLELGDLAGEHAPDPALSPQQLVEMLSACLAAARRWANAEKRGPGRGRLAPIVKDGLTIWRGEWRDARGKRRRHYLGIDKGDAERMFAKIVRERDLERAGFGQKSGPDAELARIAELYLADLQSRVRPRAYTTARYTIESTLARLPVSTVRELTKPVAMVYVRSRLAEGRARSTVNAELTAVRAMLNFGVRCNLIEANPLAGLRALPVKAEHRVRTARALSDEEIGCLVKAAEGLDREQPESFPRGPFIVCLLETGARYSEVTGLTRGDVDFQRATLHFRAERTKTGEARSMPLTDAAYSACARTIEAAMKADGGELRSDARIFRRGDGSLWPVDSASAGYYLRKLLERAGIERATSEGQIHVHALRHTFATRCARAGIPVQMTQALTGHRKAEVLLGIYTHLSTEDTRAALGKLAPLPVQASLEGKG